MRWRLVLQLICFGQALAAEPDVTRLTWQPGVPNFGGLSAIEVSADGLAFTALSDRGLILSGTLTRDGEALSGVILDRASQLKDTRGRPVRSPLSDSEGLAVLDDGTILVAFESPTRIWSYDSPGAIPKELPRPAWMKKTIHNKGLEAIAVSPDGTILTGTEIPSDGDFSLYSLGIDGEEVVTPLPASASFLLVGADVAADGTVYLLERKLTLLGFQSRIRALRGDQIREVFTSSPGEFDNLEGIATWRDQEGRTRLTLISDDNFLALQRTEIVEITLQD
ncbi:MAG: esterase-like activity of phytase family protein [Pseudomonadota bacterium]